MSYCTDCIHYKVCGNEGIDDSAMTFCADKQIKGDLISKSVLDQIKWERDIAIEQLKDLGYEFGEKPRTKKTAEWHIVGKTTLHYECSKCGGAGDKWDKFCKNCGATMRKERKEEE